MNATHKLNKLRNRKARLTRLSKTKEGLSPRQSKRLSELS
jgi:hypothetical protein